MTPHIAYADNSQLGQLTPSHTPHLKPKSSTGPRPGDGYYKPRYTKPTKSSKPKGAYGSKRK